MQNLRSTFVSFLKSYTSLFILPILFLVVFRIIEFTLLIENVQVFHKPFRSFTYSVEFDLIFLALYYLSFFLIFYLLYKISRRLFQVTFSALFIILTFIHLALNQFFYTSDILLDKTFFYFSLTELKIILSGESGGVFSTFFWPYLISIILVAFSFWYIKPQLEKNKTLRIIGQSFTILSLCLFLFRGEVHPRTLPHYSHYEKQIHTSKLSYFFTSLYQLISPEESKEKKPFEAIETYKEIIGRESNLTNEDYPFTYSSDDLIKNNWAEYINDHEKIKNVVLIISEGLSSRFSGEEAKFGSMTPFIDSLSKQSLYWPNMLSITDRTHGVFAAALAGLPHGFERGFLNYKGKQPKYNSVSKFLKDKGYSTNFIYGGWSHFDNYHSFLVENKFDGIVNESYINEHFNLKTSNSDQKFSYGYHDQSTVDAYFQFMQNAQITSPYFNLYLTLSLHTPYDIPDKQHYIEKAKKNLTNLDADFFDQNKEIISTVYYADQSLKKFFKKYEEREDFEETIFMIMGDHSVTALDLHSELGGYHIPFILYSPKINKPQKFNEIISHWDIPSTIMDILPNLNWKTKNKLTHWLGNGVSFKNDIRSKNPIFLGTFRGDIIGVVWEEYAYIHERLYRIKEGLELEPYEDVKREKRFSKLLETYIILNKYSIKNDKITPFFKTSN
ncbi:LTA synthase family protein [Brumimicrobium aurantiacum]|uniref:DUF229 domain-containing protein n=1 Tax=Brumimicrobium aurantiacum TaxID=1737063 RepID=A0A3E1EXE8_9FLAO|nr:sulfatase-like hydrolase/transferase [Brumimicrobium aurantiacum]RFC54153.1 DUF229 domain-containing protein [Brumimicrobium aurantiacum]